MPGAIRPPVIYKKEVITMAALLARYQTALDKIGTWRLLALPESVKSVLMRTGDLEAKTQMLELIVEQLGL